jgi:hypothetical protein
MLDLAALLPVAMLVSAAAGEVPGRVVNARVQTHAAEAGLRAVFDPLAAAAGPAWIGYAMPALGRHRMCCYRSMDDIGKATPGCRLENEGGTFNVSDSDDEGRALEDAGEFVVLFRAQGGRIGRVRTVSGGCGIDAGGLPLHWITGVRPADSLELLGSMVGTGVGSANAGKGPMHEPALAAIALHADPGADALLESLVAPGQPLETRKQAAFWMGNLRGRRGYETLRRLVKQDQSPELREHAVFALSQSEVPEAIDVMIDVARHDADPEVRSQGVFWLSQKAGRKAADAITRAIEEDPETEVKEKAVFALSQLPNDESVPLLIDLARRNANPVVRKKAMFWLGQSEDPRALAFFEEVLGR